MKQEEINIADILRSMPKGTPLYSPVCGALLLVDVTPNGIFCVQPGVENDNRIAFLKDGTLKNYGNWAYRGECVLFPSKDLRQWDGVVFDANGWSWDTKNPIVPPLKFAPFDKVLVRDNLQRSWCPAFFAWMDEEREDYPFGVMDGGATPSFFRYCIPFNGKTAHLVGTNLPYNE